ncbi:hypothetical protein F5880DRAFT_1479281, partial [Lentinula raphanica]
LELNTHQRILADIASNVGETVDDIHHANTLIASLVQTRADVGEKLEESKYEVQPASRVLCNIAFGELVVNFPDNHISENIHTLMPVLKDILRDVPHIEFDKCLSWEEWALPDQLVYSSITALPRIARSHPSYAASATETICMFISDMTMRKTDSRE